MSGIYSTFLLVVITINLCYNYIMKLFSEHTEWNGAGVNHWYLLNDTCTTMFGYRKFSQGPVTLFRTPLPFYEKGRKLRLEHDFGDLIERNIIHVAGSKGSVYSVDLSGDHPKCTCHGFKFRGGCKHIALAQQQNENV